MQEIFLNPLNDIESDIARQQIHGCKNLRQTSITTYHMLN